MLDIMKYGEKKASVNAQPKGERLHCNCGQLIQKDGEEFRELQLDAEMHGGGMEQRVAGHARRKDRRGLLCPDGE